MLQYLPIFKKNNRVQSVEKRVISNTRNVKDILQIMCLNAWRDLLINLYNAMCMQFYANIINIYLRPPVILLQLQFLLFIFSTLCASWKRPFFKFNLKFPCPIIFLILFNNTVCRSK